MHETLILLTEADNKEKPKRGIIRKAAGDLLYTFVGRLPQQLSEQRSRLGGFPSDIISRDRTSTPIAEFTASELRNLHKGSRIDAVVMGVLLPLLFLGAWRREIEKTVWNQSLSATWKVAESENNPWQ